MDRQWIKEGMYAKSKAGHDKGKLYRIVRVEGSLAWLTNDQNRTQDNPKKKKLKHIQVIKQNPMEDFKCQKQM